LNRSHVSIVLGGHVAGRVLVIDDDPTLRRGLTVLIRSQGHEVMAAGTIAEGMERLAWGPSHILLDMNLPDGDGTRILRHVRSAKLPVKVAVLSGSADLALMAEADAMNPDAHFMKPANWSVLLDWIAVHE
jgi:DNA-binding response OmpR family regulator